MEVAPILLSTTLFIGEGQHPPFICQDVLQTVGLPAFLGISTGECHAKPGSQLFTGKGLNYADITVGVFHSE